MTGIHDRNSAVVLGLDALHVPDKTATMEISAIVLTLISGGAGVVVGCQLTYQYQKRLLLQQIEAQKVLADRQIEFLEAQAKKQTETSKEAQKQFHDFLEKKILVALLTRWNTTFSDILPLLSRAHQVLDKIESQSPDRKNQMG